MGCCSSKEDDDDYNQSSTVSARASKQVEIKTIKPFNSNNERPSINKENMTVNPLSANSSAGAAASRRASSGINANSNPLAISAVRKLSVNSETIKKKEEKIELMLKSKRGNVFSQGIDDSEKCNFVAKIIPKTSKQEQLIHSALLDNFIFSNLDETSTRILINAMSIVTVEAGESVIIQGSIGDYYYIIESGDMKISVSGVEVGTIASGKGFGELALMHNTLRAATVKANVASSLFALDRTTFRFVIAQNQSNTFEEILSALKQVSIFDDLTDEQLRRICDAVEIVPYNTGDQIIKKGTSGNIFYMIKSGSVKVTDLGEKYADFELHSGDYFGERALITGEPRAANVYASGTVSLLALDREAFISLLGPLHELITDNMNMRVLTSIKLFEKLNNDERSKLSKSFEYEHFRKGDVIIRQGDKGAKFYILNEGIAKVYVGDEMIGDLKAGTYFGEMALLDDEVRKATVIADDFCDCYSIDRATFNQLLGSLSSIISRETNSRFESLSTSTRHLQTEENTLKINFADLTRVATLGSGTFGRVYLVQDKSKNVYALKSMIKSEIVAQKQTLNVVNEKNVMLQCNHPFILKLYATFKDPVKLHMLLEFIQGGELFSILHTDKGDGVPDGDAKFYGAGVMLAIAHLHSKNIAYRDMKPENCLIDKDGYPKVVDFGFAKVIEGKSFTLCGTPEYLAPELVLGRGHNKCVDYWAFGILIFEMIAGFSPYSDTQGMDQAVICRNIVNGKLVFPRAFSNDAKDIVKKLLSREVQNRLGNLKGGPDDILNHDWFNTINFDKYMSKSMPAPWKPAVTSATDTSAFDQYIPDEVYSTNYVDSTNWDQF